MTALVDPDLPRGLVELDQLQGFIFAGNAVFTMVSRVTGSRFTYKVKQGPSALEDKADDPMAPYFINVLSGSDNERDYSFIGTLFPPHLGKIKLSRKSKVGIDAPSFKAIAWLLQCLEKKVVPHGLEVWHEGRCCVCGRVLTDPESIARGIGPQCLEAQQFLQQRM